MYNNHLKTFYHHIVASQKSLRDLKTTIYNIFHVFEWHRDVSYIYILWYMHCPRWRHHLHRMHRKFWAKKSLILRVGDIGWFLSYFFIIILPRHGRTVLFIHVKARKCIISLYWFGDLKKKQLLKTSFYEIKILMVRWFF